MASIITPNMSLILPTIGSEPGPAYAQDQNSSFSLVDQHDHSSGKGVAITTAGLNINADLSIAQNNLTNIRSLRLFPQPGNLSGALDLTAIYSQGVDLYFRDGSGNNIRITQSGGISGTSGSIGGLASPASATYVSATPAFVFQSAANTPANLDGGALVLRNITASSKGITLNPPNSLAANYSLTLPAALPAATYPMQLDVSGNISAGGNMTVPGNLTTTGTLNVTGNVTIGGSSVQIGGAGNAVLQGLGTTATLYVTDSTLTTHLPLVVSANPSIQGLMIVRGTVSMVLNGSGQITSISIVTGEGFTVSGSGTVFAVVTYSTAFVDFPSTTANLANFGGTQWLNPFSAALGSSSSITKFAYGGITGGTYIFNFISIGQRT